MKPLNIAAYFDGRLGHEKQTRGILNALAQMTPVEVHNITLSPSPLNYLKNWLTYFSPVLQGERQGIEPLLTGGIKRDESAALEKKKSWETKERDRPSNPDTFFPHDVTLILRSSSSGLVSFME